MKHVFNGWIAAALLPLMVATGGCQLNTQDKASSGPMQLSGPTKNCFGQSLTAFELYFKGDAQASDVDGAFSCISGALDTFSTYSRGSTNRESFSANELRVFLQEHFLGNVKLNDAILLEFMRVKQALLGGAIDRLTKTEITHLTTVLETFRVEAQRLRPYITLLGQNGPSVDPNLLEQGLSDLNFSMETIGLLLADSKEPYKLENLKTLLVEFQALYAGRSDWKGPAWFSTQMPLLSAAKALLIRPDGGTIQPDEWRLLFSHIGRIYGLYLRFNYVIKGKDLFYGEALSQIDIGVNQVSDVLEDAIHAKGTDKIDYTLLRAFFTALDKGKAFSLPLQATTIAGLLEPLFERILNPVIIDKVKGTKFDPGDKLSAKGYRAVQGGLTMTNLEVLRDSILSWIEMQQLWERLEKDAVRRDPSLFGQPIPIRIVRELWSGYTPHYTESWTDLKSLFERPLPPITYPDGRLMMVAPNAFVVDRAAFASLNWKQQLVRTLGYGYVSDPDALRMTGITLNQMKELFDDFWQATLDLKFLDPSDKDIWKTGFTISNIFLYSSNGDDRLSFHEAVDLFVFSFASSVISKEKIRIDVMANCKQFELDPAGIPKIQSACWRNRVRKGYDSFFDSLPAWPKLVKGWSNDAWNSFFDDLEKASRKKTNPTGNLMSSEMDRAISIHHYIEAMFTRWDSDHNGELSMEEADKAFFLFKSLLKTASGFTDDDEVRALYFYLLTFGEPPESLGNKLYWLWWKRSPDAWAERVKANRAMLTVIFGNLAAQL